MIRSFADKNARALFEDRDVRMYRGIERMARRKLLILHGVTNLEELRIPPGNRLEQLSGNRAGQFSIRINRQWRVCFKWIDNNAHDVEIVDYH